MDDIRVGVVGVGHLGNYHLQKYEKLSKSRIIGVADIMEDRHRKAAETFNSKRP